MLFVHVVKLIINIYIHFIIMLLKNMIFKKRKTCSLLSKAYYIIINFFITKYITILKMYIME